MPNTLQEFLAAGTQKASADLVTAFLRIPEEKRRWSPEGKSRSALDQMAECAILNGYTADTLQSHEMKASLMANFFPEKEAAVASGWEKIQTLLEENTSKVVAAIRAVSDDDLGFEVATPWRPMTLAQISSYPSWNMTYHEGQINYIASMLGCLD